MAAAKRSGSRTSARPAFLCSMPRCGILRLLVRPFGGGGFSPATTEMLCTMDVSLPGTHLGTLDVGSWAAKSSGETARIHKNWWPRARHRELRTRSRALACGGALFSGRRYVGVMITIRFASPSRRWPGAGMTVSRKSSSSSSRTSSDPRRPDGSRRRSTARVDASTVAPAARPARAAAARTSAPPSAEGAGNDDAEAAYVAHIASAARTSAEANRRPRARPALEAPIEAAGAPREAARGAATRPAPHPAERRGERRGRRPRGASRRVSEVTATRDARTIRRRVVSRARVPVGVSDDDK